MGGPQVSETYINNMSFGLQQWVTGAKTGNVKWGFFRFEKIGGKAQGVNVKTPGTNLSLNLPNLFFGFGLCCKRHGLERVLSFLSQQRRSSTSMTSMSSPILLPTRSVFSMRSNTSVTTQRAMSSTHTSSSSAVPRRPLHPPGGDPHYSRLACTLIVIHVCMHVVMVTCFYACRYGDMFSHHA